MIFHPNLRHWKTALFVLRCFIFSVFIFDIAIWFQLVPLPAQSASRWTYLPWFIYRLSYYLFFEGFWHHYKDYRAQLIHLFVLILTLFLIGVTLDLAGNTFGLFTQFWWYDRMIHLTTLPWGISAVFWFFSHIFAERHRLTHLSWLIPYAMFSGLALVTVFHEIIEYLIDLMTQSQMGTMSGNDLYDASRDSLLNMIGGSFFIACYILREKVLSRKG